MIRRNHLSSECEDVEESWVGRCLDRHRHILQAHCSKHLDTERARFRNPEAKKKWVELLEEFVVKLGITYDGRNKLFSDALGRHLTDPEMIQVTAMEGQKKKNKETEKARRRSDREADAIVRAAMEEQ